MPGFDLRSAISAFIGGRETEADRRAIRQALEGGRIALASGERAVAVGGNVEGAIITGNNNLVLSLDKAGFGTVQRMFDDLLRPGTPEPPLYLPGVPVSEWNTSSRYHYTSDRVEFRGRLAELDELVAFANKDSSFLWWSIIAPTGHGKSRLAYEFMKRIKKPWRSGFLLFGHSFSEHWNHWQPRCPTIIAIDDASVRSKEIYEIITAIAPRAAKNHEAHLKMPVRLLAIDRHDLWFADLAAQDRSFWQDLAAPTIHDGKPVSLSRLSDDDMNAILSEIAGPNGAQAVLNARRYGDVNSAVLIGLILADEVARDGQIGKRDRTELIRDFLRQTDESLWTALGVTDDDRALLALATMLGEIRFAELKDLTGVFPHHVDRKIVDRLGRMVGLKLSDRLFAMTPDLIGELFVLDTLDEFSRFGDPRADELPAAAWRRDCRSLAAMLQRASEDFPQHPILTQILISPLSHDVSDWSSWTGVLLQQVLNPSTLTAAASHEEIWGKTVGALTAFRSQVPHHQVCGFLARAAVSAMTLYSSINDSEWVERAFAVWMALLNDSSCDPTVFLENVLAAASLLHCELPAPSEDEENLRVELGQLSTLVDEREDLIAEVLAQHSNLESYFASLLSVSEQSHPATHAVMATGDALGIFAAMYHKARFERPRPFRRMPALLPLIMPPSLGSYPGGHATRSHLMADCLTTVIPQQENENFLPLLAERISRNREVAGLNYPSDSAAGVALAASLTPVLHYGICASLIADAKAEWP